MCLVRLFGGARRAPSSLPASSSPLPLLPDVRQGNCLSGLRVLPRFRPGAHASFPVQALPLPISLLGLAAANLGGLAAALWVIRNMQARRVPALRIHTPDAPSHSPHKRTQPHPHARAATSSHAFAHVRGWSGQPPRLLKLRACVCAADLVPRTGQQRTRDRGQAAGDQNSSEWRCVLKEQAALSSPPPSARLGPHIAACVCV